MARHHGNERKRNGVNRERKSVATENRMIRSCGHWTAIAAPRYSHRSSSVTFHDGCSHLRIRVTIRINNNEVARGLANRQQNWRLIDSCAGLRQSIALSSFGDGSVSLICARGILVVKVNNVIHIHLCISYLPRRRSLFDVRASPCNRTDRGWGRRR